MTVYFIAHVKVTDDSWIPAYAEQVHDIVHRHGGKYLSRSANITPIEGAPPDSTVVGILSFPTMADLKGFVEPGLRQACCSPPQRGSEPVLRH